jgi:nucleoside phosphorylase
MNAINERNCARLIPPSAALTAEFSKKFQPAIKTTPALPAVNWSALGQQAPTLLTTSSGELPSADAVVIAWTDAEWAAMEHVFCNSSASMSYAGRNQSSWPGWQKYIKGLPTIKDFTYWGEFRLVQVGNSKVLLFKSETHLDYPGKQYLSQLIGRIVSNAKPKLILSTGTAGGARPTDHIGTVNVVHAATLYESKQPQSTWPEYTNAWHAGWGLMSHAGFKKLLFPVPTTLSDLQSICSQFNSFWGVSFTLTDLNPGNVNTADSQPAMNNLTTAGTPLLTTDSFVVGTNSGNLGSFACVEMDDAIIAEICVASKIAYGSVRNISDPVQNSTLPDKIQAHWGQAIYDAYGLYTSYNGAIAAWAVLNN